MFIDNKLIRWDKKADPTDIPNLTDIMARYQADDKQTSITIRHHEELIPWNEVRIIVEFALQTAFTNILDFFVNLPSTQKELINEEVVNSWYWNDIPHDKPLSELFTDRDAWQFIKKGAQLKDGLVTGWIVRKAYGRVDEDTTDSDFSYLFRAGEKFVYVQIYAQTLH